MMVPDFTGVTAEREEWVASLVAADCTNVNMFKRCVESRNVKRKAQWLMGSKCKARC